MSIASSLEEDEAVERRERNKVSSKSSQLTFASLHIPSALPFPHSSSDIVGPLQSPIHHWMSLQSNEGIKFRSTVQGLSFPSCCSADYFSTLQFKRPEMPHHNKEFYRVRIAWCKRRLSLICLRSHCNSAEFNLICCQWKWNGETTLFLYIFLKMNWKRKLKYSIRM